MANVEGQKEGEYVPKVRLIEWPSQMNTQLSQDKTPNACCLCCTHCRL